MKTYIAVYDAHIGTGETLEDALAELKEKINIDQDDDIEWFEADSIQVEFKIIKKEVPIKSKKEN